MAEKKQPKKKKKTKSQEIPAWKRKDAMRNQKASWASQSAPRPVHRPQKH